MLVARTLERVCVSFASICEVDALSVFSMHDKRAASVYAGRTDAIVRPCLDHR